MKSIVITPYKYVIRIFRLLITLQQVNHRRSRFGRTVGGFNSTIPQPIINTVTNCQQCRLDQLSTHPSRVSIPLTERIKSALLGPAYQPKHHHYMPNQYASNTLPADGMWTQR
jgi:hypothetical protein